MTKEISELLTVLSGLAEKMPDTALYILAGFFVFKITALIVPAWGVISVVKMGIEKWHSWATKPETYQWRVVGDIMISDGTDNYLKAQVGRIRNRVTKNTSYIHKQDVDWLRKAIDEKIERENEKRNSKEMG